LRQFGCLTGAKKVCWPPFTILWLLEPTLKGDLIVLGFYGVVKVREQLEELSNAIRADKMRAASQGCAQSGAMINGVVGRCIDLVKLRAKYVFEILGELPFKYSSSLRAKILEISLKYFPEDLGEIYTHLDSIIKFANGERARDSFINKVKHANETEIDGFKVLLDQFLLNLKKKIKILVEN
jgi:hypothetical protein